MNIIRSFIYFLKKIYINFLFICGIYSCQTNLYVMRSEVKYKFTRILHSKNFNKNKLLKSYNKINSILNVSINNNIDCPELYMWASIPEYCYGRIEDWKAKRLFYIKNQNKKILKKQKKGSNFLVLEPNLLISTVGTSMNIDALIKAQILGYEKNKKLILPIIKELKNNIVNQTLINYFAKYIEIEYDETNAKYYHSLLGDLKSTYDEHIPCKSDEIVPDAHSSSIFIQKIWNDKGFKPLFKLSEEHLLKGSKILTLMGVPKNSWYAVCHVRTSGFKGAEKFRDADIKSYYKAFESIKKEGGWVIRLGDKKMGPLPKMDKVIDYANSEFKSDFMDVFLCGSAKFMLGTSSGPAAISYIFGVPVVLTNNLPTGATYLGSQDFFMPKRMQYKHSKIDIDIVDIMTPPFNLAFNDGIYDNILKVDIIENTEEEIKDITIEMMEKINGTLNYSDEETYLQNKFKEITAKKETVPGLPNFQIQCNIGRKFIRDSNFKKNLKKYL